MPRYFSIFYLDAQFYVLFDGVIFEIDILHFFKLCPFFLMLTAEQLQMRLPIHVSHQIAVQLFWSAPRVHFYRATVNVHGSVTQIGCKMHFQVCSRLS